MWYAKLAIAEKYLKVPAGRPLPEMYQNLGAAQALKDSLGPGVIGSIDYFTENAAIMEHSELERKDKQIDQLKRRIRQLERLRPRKPQITEEQANAT